MVYESPSKQRVFQDFVIELPALPGRNTERLAQPGIMSRFLESLSGPNLHRIRKAGSPGFNYVPNPLERYSSYTLLAVKCLWFLCKLTSPLLIIALYKKGAFNLHTFNSSDFEWIFRPFVFVVTVAGAAYAARGVGRYFNPEYAQFVKSMSHYKKHKTAENAERLVGGYDFDFFNLPVEFTATAPLKRPVGGANVRQMGVLWKIVALIMLKTIGRRLLYPGSLQLIKTAMGSALADGRSRLMESSALRTKRGKIGTVDGNFIDTMFVDRRGQTPQGNILVVCCEGNAGFYEVGILTTPLQGGYSVLGWNHPGFGCSTGEALPSQEVHAVDAVMQYALTHLHFRQRDVMVFAWSIGGFPAAWLAATYPHIRGVVLDATFDDLLPLAIARMPRHLTKVVTDVIRRYLNLNVADLLSFYQGPILLIRRTLDEIIAVEDVEMKTIVNRGDYLLKRILIHRYPNILNVETLPLLDKWLRSSQQERALLEMRYLGDHKSRLVKTLDEYLAECSVSSPFDISFPLPIGINCDLTTRQHLTLFLANLHMEDIAVSHCAPLPVEMFRHPWHPIAYADFSTG